MRKWAYAFVAAFAVLPLVTSAAQPLRARLVRDIDTDFEAGPSMPYAFAAGPSRVYFAATLPEVGTELFSIDGVSLNGGVRLEADVAPGPPSSTPRDIFPAERTVYFSAAADNAPTVLYAFDSATRQTTELGSYPFYMTTIARRDVAIAGDRLFVIPEYADPALTTSDGTVAGTGSLLAALGPGRAPVQRSLIAEGGIAYFLVNLDPGVEFWKSDGTLAGTVRIATLDGTTGAYQPCVVDYDGAYWLRGNGGIWRHAFGSATIERLGSLPGDGNYFECRAAGLGGALYYVLSSGPSEELWRSGPTVGDTTKVTALADDPDFSTPASKLAVAGHGLVFWKHSLWRSDGTAAGTARVATPGGSVFSAASDYCCFRDIGGGRVLFEGYNGDQPIRPTWITDGSDAGTHSLGSPSAVSLIDAAVLGGRAYGRYFGDYATGGAADAYPEVWSLDDSTVAPDATVWYATAGAILNGGFAYDGATRADGTSLLFQRYFPVTPYLQRPLIQKSDGTDVGTIALAPETYTGYIYSFARGDAHRTLFLGDDPPGVFIADASLTQIERVADAGGDLYGYETASGPNVLFTCDEGICGLDAAMASRVTLTSDVGTGEIAMVGSVNGAGLYFRNTLFDGWALWRTDGTAAGTFALASVRQFMGHPRDNVPSIARDGHIYFDACGADDVCALWTSDGTVAGTRALGTLDVLSTIESFAFAGNRLTFVAMMQEDPSGAYRKLWSYDLATQALTGLLDSRDLGDNTTLSAVASGGNVVRLASIRCNGDCASHLWSSDGTSEGTTAMTGSVPWTAMPGAFVAFDDAHSVFTCFAPDIGTELCETDGTAAGTRLIRDIYPGYIGSRPTLAIAGGRIYFAADDGRHGMEVWTLDGDAIFADGYESN